MKNGMPETEQERQMMEAFRQGAYEEPRIPMEKSNVVSPNDPDWFDKTYGNPEAEAELHARAKRIRSEKTYINADDKYWDATDQEYRSLGELDPGKDSGKYALTSALSDTNSAASNMYYYGGYKNAASDKYNAFTNRAGELENRELIGLNTGDYAQTLANQQSMLGRYRAIQAGASDTAAQNQLASTYGTARSNINAQLASSQGGLLSVAASRNAARTAGENAMRTYNRDANILRANESIQAMGQQSGLLNAMRDTEQSRAFAEAGIRQDSRTGNLNAAANMNKLGLAALQKGLEGSINRERARNQVYGNAVNVDVERNKLDTAIEDQQFGTAVGGLEGAFTSIGKVYTGRRGSDEDNKPTT